jgi:hypothetical protein
MTSLSFDAFFNYDLTMIFMFQATITCVMLKALCTIHPPLSFRGFSDGIYSLSVINNLNRLIVTISVMIQCVLNSAILFLNMFFLLWVFLAIKQFMEMPHKSFNEA